MKLFQKKNRRRGEKQDYRVSEKGEKVIFVMISMFTIVACATALSYALIIISSLSVWR